MIQAPVAKAQMLIRKPASEVFEALVDPTITSRFWFSKGSSRLQPGKRVRWDWEMYGVSAEVDVKAIDQNKRVLFEWNGPGHPTSVEWTLVPMDEDQTFVIIKNWGFDGNTDEMVAAAIDSTGGFSVFLAGLKAFLEHGVELELVADHDPAALVGAWASRRDSRKSVEEKRHARVLPH